MLLANGLSTSPIKGNRFFNNGSKSIQFFWCTILADELLAKALKGLEICVLVNNNLCGKLFSSLESPTTFDEIFKSYLSTTFYLLVSYNLFFNLLSCVLDNFPLKVLYWVILYWLN